MNDTTTQDLAGRTAVVTGAAGGLGIAIGRALQARGAHLVMAVRDTARAAHRAAEAGLDPARLETVPLDLMDLASIREAAGTVTARHPAVDLLILNAGASSQRLRLSPEGIESQFATNHLGHFALTAHLLGALEKGTDPRVVTVSSALYRAARLDLDHLDGARGYDPGRAYNHSKLANVLFARELGRRLGRAGSPVRSLAAHPGMARTPLHDTYPSPVIRAVTKLLAATIGRDPENAVVPILHAATAPDADPSLFHGPAGRRVTRVESVPFAPIGTDDDAARTLWTFSERVTGLTVLP